MDWIVAAATPPLPSALGVVRASGSDLEKLRDAVLRPLRPGPWRSGRTRRIELFDAAGVFDDGIAVWSRSPHSYTGEDTFEVSLHGNPLLVARFVDACIAAGARLAGPGAFTRRAVLNGKLTLLAAEGVDLTIRATSEAGLAIARQTQDLSTELHALRQRLIQVTAELEARLDHPSDELARETDFTVLNELAAIGARCTELSSTHALGRRLVEGATVALVGPVNVGKSSLFNALVGSKRALVHDGPGTTRDVVEARIQLGGIEIRLLDTAGERSTDDPIEAAGLALAGEMIQEADLWLVVHRSGAHDPVVQAIVDRADRPVIEVANGIDRVRATHGLGVSALTGEGIDVLRSQISTQLGSQNPGDLVLASARQAQLTREIATSCVDAIAGFHAAGVAVAADLLTEALEAVDQLTGHDTREDVLDALFARFCIGK